jgi:poly(A) polymerase/tRNA nucleotidyltransferase (CCA-adding enzyme)
MMIPKEIKEILIKLDKAGFQAFVVGGCVRDSLIGVKPTDWDIATNARPEKIVELFPKNFQDNDFGMVTVLTGSQDETLKEVQVMPYRAESKYTDKRHPDKIFWVKTIEEDLARRDFTINAIALSLKGEIVDPFDGQKDLEKKLIKAVGEPEQRFSEDALRMMRAVRFNVTLGKNWKIDEATEQAIKNNAELLKVISQERIRDELMKIIMSDRPSEGIELLRKLGLLTYIIPELEENYQVSQNKHHIYDCYQHALFSLKYAAQKRYNQYVRIAALLHDIAKPRVKQGEGPDATFYGHEIVGAIMTKKILTRLRFSNKDIEKITKLVRYHLFYYNVGEVSESSVRRLLRNVGLENIEELLQVRYCDRIGSGCPKAEPYKLRHLRYLIEKVSQDPISVSNLKISGNEVMEILNIKPGPKIGQILDTLLGEVLEDPQKNTKTYLQKRTKELAQLKGKELEELATEAREERKKIEIKMDEMTKKKYWVT